MKTFSMTIATLATMMLVAVPAGLDALQIPGAQQQQQERQQQADSIKGEITEVQENRLVITSEDGETMTFRIDDETWFRDKTKRPTEGQRLEAGQQVTIHYRAGVTPAAQQRALAIEVTDDNERGLLERMDPRDVDPEQRPEQQLQAQDSVRGTVMELRQEENTLVVLTQDGERMTFRVDQQTRIEEDEPTPRRPQPRQPQPQEQRQQAMQQLEPGTQVTVEYREGDTPDEHTAVVIQIRDDEERDPAARLDPREHEPVRERQERPDRERDVLNLWTDQAEGSVTGEITRVEDDRIVVRDEEGDEMTFLVDEETWLRDDARAPAEEFKLESGKKVQVHFKHGERPEEHKAVAIEVRDDEERDRRYEPRQDPR